MKLLLYKIKNVLFNLKKLYIFYIKFKNKLFCNKINYIIIKIKLMYLCHNIFLKCHNILLI